MAAEVSPSSLNPAICRGKAVSIVSRMSSKCCSSPALRNGMVMDRLAISEDEGWAVSRTVKVTLGSNIRRKKMGSGTEF